MYRHLLSACLTFENQKNQKKKMVQIKYLRADHLYLPYRHEKTGAFFTKRKSVFREKIYKICTQETLIHAGVVKRFKYIFAITERVKLHFIFFELFFLSTMFI